VDANLDELLAIDAALEKLAALDERMAKVVELRFFGGLEEEEIAETLDVNVRTVRRDWRKARAFILTKITASAS
jgi:RNA polymerase sigma factor (sigma-70 family)